MRGDESKMTLPETMTPDTLDNIHWAFIAGVVDKIYGADRTPPSYLDDEEAVKWLEGWDQ